VAEIIQLEQKLECCLVQLKEKFGLRAVKAEFEAEGASFRDLLRLRRLTAGQNLPLYLKVGGVEALRDIKDALDLGVDGLIAPMVESPFGVVKFVSAVESVFSLRKIHKSINIETREAVDLIDKILDVAQDKVDNVTIGRTDLSQSYFDSKVQPDSPFILDLIERLSHKIQACGLTVTVGGSLTSKSIRLFQQRRDGLGDRVSSMETRKVVLPIEKMLEQGDALKESLHFEELYLRYKLACEAWLSRPDQERLDKLKTRL
jgi:4-hydroxy-2-oxoheptanedioate aldolase